MPPGSDGVKADMRFSSFLGPLAWAEGTKASVLRLLQCPLQLFASPQPLVNTFHGMLYGEVASTNIVFKPETLLRRYAFQFFIFVCLVNILEGYRQNTISGNHQCWSAAIPAEPSKFGDLKQNQNDVPSKRKHDLNSVPSSGKPLFSKSIFKVYSSHGLLCWWDYANFLA